jgi:hypothetical protein
MARIRTIKPEFFVSEQVAEVSPTCRLLFVGMWLFCDDAGIHPASAKQLKMEVFPGDQCTSEQIAEMIDELLRVGLLIEYEAEGRSYWQVTGWHHQKIDRPRFQYPAPDSTTPRRIVADTSTIPRSLTVPDPTVPDPTGDESKCAKRTPYPPLFEEFWKAYPQAGRVRKKSALAAWRVAERQEDAQTIIAAAREYAGCGQVKAGFCRQATTWLNGASWDDDRAAWEGNGKAEDKIGKLLEGWGDESE